MRRVILAVGAVCLALSAWWLLPRPAPSPITQPAVEVVLVDASASVVRQRPDWLPWLRRRLGDLARDADERRHEVAVVVFAEEVERRFGPGPAGELIARLEATAGEPFRPHMVRDLASDLAGALELAAGFTRAPGRPPGRVVLIGDGTWSGVDPAAARARLGPGVSFERLDPPPPSLPEAALLELTLPAVVEVGAPLVASATVRLQRTADQSAVLMCEVEDGAGISPRMVPLPAAAAPGQVETLRVPIELGAAAFGRTTLEARVVLSGAADPIPENDVLRASAVAEGERVVGAVAKEASRVELAAWIRRGGADLFPGLHVLLLEPDDLPGALDRLDLVVTFDLPADALPSHALEPFVARGGGWLALSGWGFLGDWAHGQDPSRLRALLPMRPAPVEGGPRDVIVMVDGSGSMAGEPFERVRAAAVEMVAAAPPTDAIELAVFTKTIGTRRALRRFGDSGGREEAARALLGTTVPGGSTWILSCLQDLAIEREAVDREALVLLLTDGQEGGNMASPGAKARELVERFRAARTRLRVIAVGEQADLAFLGNLVAPGEEVVRAQDLTDLATIFQREINRARVRGPEPGEDGLVLRAVPPVEGALAAELATAVSPEDLPPVQRIVRNEAREDAEVLWETERGEPVLALRRHGLGRVALVSTVPRESWADAWIGTAENFGALLRWLGRGRQHLGPTARVRDGRVVLEGLEGDWPARLAARLMDPRGSLEDALSLDLELSQAHPGDSGRSRRSADLPPALAQRAAGRSLSLLLEVPPGLPLPAGPLALAVDLPRAPEFAPAAGLPLGGRAGTGRPPSDPAWAAGTDEALGPAPQDPGVLATALLALGLALVFLGGVLGPLARAIQAAR